MTILQQQCLLTYLGYSPGAIDGVNGPKTKAAIKSFQTDNGLTATGDCDASTQKMLTHNVAYGTLRKPEIAISATVSDDDFWPDVEYFTETEFNCKCGGKYCNGRPNRMKKDVVMIADAARKHFGKRATVISGLRCKEWNALNGGVANSQHQYGEAIDLRIDGVSAAELQKFVSSQKNCRYSYCINSTNVHFDINPVGR